MRNFAKKALLTVALLTAEGALAGPPTPSTIPPELQKVLSGPLTPELKQGLQEFKRAVVSPYQKRSQYKGTKETRTIVRHLRGKEGIPFDSVPPNPVPNIDFQKLEKTSEQDLQKEIAREKKLLNQVPDLPRCPKNVTYKDPNPAPPQSGKGSELLYDTLFIRAEDLSENPEVSYGGLTLLRIFDRKNPTPDTFLALSGVVPCLPYRIRVTSRYEYFHEGEDALLNYEENLDGSGRKVVVHEDRNKP